MTTEIFISTSALALAALSLGWNIYRDLAVCRTKADEFG